MQLGFSVLLRVEKSLGNTICIYEPISAGVTGEMKAPVSGSKNLSN